MAEFSQEIKDLLEHAKEEITLLRRRNEILEAQVRMIDLFTLVLHTPPARMPSGPMGVDTVWLLEQQLNKLKEKVRLDEAFSTEPEPKPVTVEREDDTE